MEETEQIIGKYRLIEPLGRGGFSVVYRAEHMTLGNEVALKILNPSLAQDEMFARRFRREARRTVMLDHPNIVRVLDLDEVDGQLFIAMEYVPSRDLRELMAEEELLPLDQVVSLVRQLGEALDYAHRQGLIHRDVKPGNVLVREDGVVKLTDFGLVKAAEGSQLTQTGTTLGTPAYMSPEQTRGDVVDARSDLYALGVMAYEFVTGQVPFHGDTPVSVVYMHVHETPPLPSTISRRADGPIEPVLLKALAKDPAERYQTGAALAAALAEAIFGTEEDSPAASYDQAVTLLQDRRYGEALEVLKSIQMARPDYRDVATLVLKAEEGERLAELYAKANHHLTTARDLATQIAASDPDFPDTQKVLQAVVSQSQENPQEEAIARSFDDGLSAYLNQRWLRARNAFEEVVRQRPEYSRSGQKAANLLAQSKKQVAVTRRTVLTGVVRTIGRALAVLLVLTIIFAVLHLLVFRPALEETVYDLIEPVLDPLVEADIFPGRGSRCVRWSERGLNQKLADDLAGAKISGRIELLMDPGQLEVQAQVGQLMASVSTQPMVLPSRGLVELGEFRSNWLVQLFFSRNGLQSFIEEYINQSILVDGRMWLEEVSIETTSLRVCVAPRNN
jgi:serine/threonine protein kinase